MNLPISEEIQEAPAETITMRLMEAGPSGGSRSDRSELRRAEAGASGKGVDPGLRLLADLLAEIVGIAALGGCDGVPFDMARGALHGIASKGRQPDAGSGDVGNFTILHHEGETGVLKNRGDVGGDEVLAMTETKNEWGCGFSGDEAAGFGFGIATIEKEPRNSRYVCADGLGQIETRFELLLRSRWEIISVSVSERSSWLRSSRAARNSM